MSDFFPDVIRRVLLLAIFWLSASVLLSCGRTALDTTAPPQSDAASPTPMLAENLPESPTDLDFWRRPLFHERLVPLGGSTTPAENRALAAAIRAGLSHRELIHTDELDAFLREHPQSPWRASLLTNLGILWRSAARYGDALRAWEEAWTLTKSETSWRGRATADRAVSELAYLNAQLGRQRRLSELFAELSTRPPLGAAAERTGLARLGLASMIVHPERSFRCGPLAVGSAWRVLHPRGDLPEAIDATNSTTEGTSFTQLLALADRIGAPMRAMHRRPGTGFVVPSVIHWRQDHFAAIVATGTSRGGERIYVIQDATFGPEVRTTDRWLEQETSGNVLIPSSVNAPEGWEELDAEAASHVWGRGQTSGFDPDAFGDRDLAAQCEGSRGMARYGFHAHTAALHVEDTPIWVHNAFGPEVSFKVAYNQADREQAQMPWSSSIGARWTHNWESYLELTNTASPRTWRRRIGGGGVATHREDSGGTARERHGGLGLELRSLSIPLSPPLPPTITSRAADGSVETFQLSEDGFVLRWYLQSRADPQGNTATISYDSDRRITLIAGADGRALSFHYRSDEPSSSEFYLVAHVDDAHSRSAVLDYASHPSQPWFRLNKITDLGGLTSSFGYSEVARGFQDTTMPFATVPDPDFLSQLTTPYGVTTFSTGWGHPGPLHAYSQMYLQRWVEAVRPGGDGERIEFREIGTRADDCAGMNPCGFDSSALEYISTGTEALLDAMRGSPSGRSSINHRDYRNTYYWNVVGYARGRSGTAAAASFDPRHAHIFHWIHGANSTASIAPVLESERPPGQHRVHYLYAGQQQLEFLPASVGDVTYEARRVLSSRILQDGNPAQRAGEDWRYQYNAHGRVVETTDPAGRVRCYHYDAMNPEDLTSVHAAPCASVSGPTQTEHRLLRIQYYTGGHHLPLNATGPDGQTTHWYYNARGQVLRELRPDGKALDYFYDDSSSVYPPGTSIPGFGSIKEGRLLSVRFRVPSTDGGVSNARVATLEYHPNGTVSRVVDAEGVERSFAYDDLERITSITAPGTAAGPRVTTFAYTRRDEAGNALPGTGFEPTTITFPGGQTVTRAYDSLHRLIRSANGSADLVRYRYNRVRSAGASSHFDLVQKLRDDGNDDVRVAWSLPITTVPATNNGILGHSASFQQTAQRRERLGGTQSEEAVVWQHDLLGRVQQVTEGSDVATVSRRVDGLPDRVCEGTACTATSAPRHDFVYEPTGNFQRLTQVRWFRGAAVAEQERTTEFHPLGALGALLPSLHTESWNGTSASVVYSFDAVGRVNRAETPSDDLRYDLDALDRPWRIRRGTNGADELARANYSEINGAIRPDQIFETFHGCRRAISYHDATSDFRVYQQTSLNDLGTTLSTQRRWYELSSRTSAEEDQLGAGPWSWRGFYYDSAGRLQWAYDANAAGGYWRNYENTVHGTNWWFGIHNGSIWLQYQWTSADSHDRPTYQGGYLAGPPESWPGSAITTDARGRVTSDGDYSYIWDSRDRLTRVERSQPYESWQFEYDGDGRLRRFQEGGQWRRLIWVAGELYQELTGSTQGLQPTVRRSFHIDGVSEGSTRYLYDRDARGSILRFVQNGQVQHSWGYDPQGNRFDLGGAHSVGSRLGFAGYVTHEDTGLMFTPNRVYSARLRQWLSRDPLGERDSIDGNNLYAYAANDPVNYTDPSGLNPVALVYDIQRQALQYAGDSINSLGTNCQPNPGSYVAGAVQDALWGVGSAAALGMVGIVYSARRSASVGYSGPIYRGVHHGHNRWAEALRGEAWPGNVNGPADWAAHSGGNTHHTSLTSWTTNRGIARIASGPDGVILETTLPPHSGPGWSIVNAPGSFAPETEVFMQGVRSGLRVTTP